MLVLIFVFMIIFFMAILGGSTGEESFSSSGGYGQSTWDDEDDLFWDDPDPFCDRSTKSHAQTHAEWVRQDAEKRRKVNEDYERGFIEDYMDEHDLW